MRKYTAPGRGLSSKAPAGEEAATETPAEPPTKGPRVLGAGSEEGTVLLEGGRGFAGEKEGRFLKS